MQQSVFTDEQTAVPEQLSERHILVSNSQSALIISLVLAGAAFLASLVAIVLAYIR